MVVAGRVRAYVVTGFEPCASTVISTRNPPGLVYYAFGGQRPGRQAAARRLDVPLITRDNDIEKWGLVRVVW